MTGSSRIPLVDGARVAVIGGGPSGSFFAFFLRQMAQRVGREFHVDLYEPRDFTLRGPRGCNMCGGIISESLMQSLATEGIQLPTTVIHRRIDSYFLHMDVGSVRIATPAQEMRIAAVARCAGPTGAGRAQESFDAHLLERAVQMGVRHVRQRVSAVGLADGFPYLTTDQAGKLSYDFLVAAVGVNSALLQSLANLPSYRPPPVTRAFVTEFMLGEELIQRYLGSAMHVFLLDIPRLEFAALIPKSDFVTLCLLGDEIDQQVIEAFMASREVKEVLPPHWQVPKDVCHCSPRLSVGSAAVPYGDRLVFIGDCGTTRLFKDGIGAAYRTAKAAARTAIFHGIAAEDFRRSFWPTCRMIQADNRMGRLVFAITGQIQRRRYARRALWRMTSGEQKLTGGKRRMSRVLWDTFTGSAPYKSVFLRSLHPAFLGRFGAQLLAGLRSGEAIRPREQVVFASGETGLAARRYAAGQVIYQQGEPAVCMYILHSGSTHLVRADDRGDHLVAELSAGDFFGETALLEHQRRTCTARVQRDSSVFTLERTSLLARIHADPSMAFRLIEHLARRIGELEASLISSNPRGPQTLALLEVNRERDGNPGAAAVAGGQMGRRYGPGEMIYRQGDRGDCMFVVQSGEVEVVRRSGEQECALALLGPGSFFGEMALFHEEIRPATARARGETYVFTLERNGLLQCIHEDPSMALQLILELARRMASLEEALVRRAPQSQGPASTPA